MGQIAVRAQSLSKQFALEGTRDRHDTLRDELMKAKHPTTFANFKDHSHISEVMSPNTADTSVTGPILKWIKSVK